MSCTYVHIYYPAQVPITTQTPAWWMQHFGPICMFRTVLMRNNATEASSSRTQTLAGWSARVEASQYMHLYSGRGVARGTVPQQRGTVHWLVALKHRHGELVEGVLKR